MKKTLMHWSIAAGCLLILSSYCYGASPLLSVRDLNELRGLRLTELPTPACAPGADKHPNCCVVVEGHRGSHAHLPPGRRVD